MKPNIKILTCAVCFVAALFMPANSSPLDSRTRIVLTQDERNWLDKNYTVRIRAVNSPPLIFTDGPLRGISIDYIKTVLDYHHITYRFVSAKGVPFRKALSLIRNHQEIDLIPIVKIKEDRKKYMVFTDEYLSFPWVIFSRTDSPFIGGMKDLDGRTVAVPDGYYIHETLMQKYPGIGLNVISGDDLIARSLEALAHGRAEAFIGNLMVGSYTIQSRGYTNIKVAAPTSFGNHKLAMAVRNDWPELASIINKTLASFSSEEQNQIINKWLSVRYEHGIHKRDVMKWVAGVSGVLLFVISMVLFSNRKLNKEIVERHLIESKLRESEKKYRLIFENVPVGIFEIDLVKNRLISVNETLCEYCGYTQQEFLTMNPLELLTLDSRALFIERFSALSKGRDIQPSVEYDIVKKDGGIIHTLFNMDYIWNGPMLVGARCIAHDISDRILKETEREKLIQKLQSALEEIQTLKGILPICSECKKIRDDDGYWKRLEAYIEEHSQASFSHSLCPKCTKNYYGNETWYHKIGK